MAARASQAAVAALRSASLRPCFKARLSQGSRAAALWGMNCDDHAPNMWHTRASIHPSAVVDPSAAVDEDAIVGPMCVIGPGVVIGAGTKLFSHCVVSRNTVIGDGCELHPFSCVGGDPQDKKYRGEASWLLLGSGCVVREHVTINLGTAAGGLFTRIGERCLVMSGVHVGHDCNVGDGAVISTSAGLAGHVEVGEGAIIGGQCGIKQRVRIGAGSMVGGKSAVVADVLPFTLVSGNPAQTHGLNLVGLRRRGATKEEIRQLQAALRFILGRADGPARGGCRGSREEEKGGSEDSSSSEEGYGVAGRSEEDAAEASEEALNRVLDGNVDGSGLRVPETVKARVDGLRQELNGHGGNGLVRDVLHFLSRSDASSRICLPASDAMGAR